MRPWRGRICDRVAFDEAEVVGIFVVDGCGVLRMKTNSRRLGALSEIEVEGEGRSHRGEAARVGLVFTGGPAWFSAVEGRVCR